MVNTSRLVLLYLIPLQAQNMSHTMKRLVAWSRMSNYLPKPETWGLAKRAFGVGPGDG